MLVGDAARQVNPLSGGGIASGIIGGKIAGTIAAEAIKMNKSDHILTYDKAWQTDSVNATKLLTELKKAYTIFQMRSLII